MENIKGLEPVQNMYKGGFFKNRHKLSWRAPIVAKALVQTYNLQQLDFVVDVGCAIGDYVMELNKQGYLACGLEGSDAAKEFFVSNNVYIWDLRWPIDLSILPIKDRKFDLAFSLEVAEHIDPLYADVYINNLCLLSDTILISAASPGQKGHGHVNCAPRGYWVDKFAKQGYINMKGTESLWRTAFLPYKDKKELSSYFKNVICFERR